MSSKYDLEYVIKELGLKPVGEVILRSVPRPIRSVRVACICEVWLNVRQYEDSAPDIWLSTGLHPRGNVLWVCTTCCECENLRCEYDEWCKGNLDAAVMLEVFS
jgi:hypothetical protein